MNPIEYKLAPITSFRIIQEELSYVAESKITCHLFGSSGFGKSVALNHFVKNNPGVFYTEIKPADTSRIFFSRLIDELNGISWTKDTHRKDGPLSWLIQRSCIDIRETRKFEVIIIDEAGNLKKGAQSLLRQLIDGLEGACSIILAGPDRYRINLDKWNADYSSGIPELMTRIARTVTLDNPSLKDIELICLKNSINDMNVAKYIHSSCHDLRKVKLMVVDYLNGNLEIS